jgi:Ca2+-binding EF-hand superfamily protein
MWSSSKTTLANFRSALSTARASRRYTQQVKQPAPVFTEYFSSSSSLKGARHMQIKMLGILTAGALLGTLLSTANFAQERTRDFGADGPREGGAHMRDASGDMRGRAGGRRGPARGTPRENFIERHDANADGQVSETEFLEERLQNVDERFERLDRDDNGLISLDEHTSRGRRGDGAGRGLRERVNAGRPARPEIDRTALTACVQKTVPDFAPRSDVSLEEMFNAIDTSGDDQLSLAEFGAAQEARRLERFDRIDADASGFVTAAEVAALGEAQSNLRRATQACVKEQRGTAN